MSSPCFCLAAVLTAIVLRWISLERWHRTQLAPETPIEIEIPEKSPDPCASHQAAGHHRQARYRAAL